MLVLYTGTRCVGVAHVMSESHSLTFYIVFEKIECSFVIFVIPFAGKCIWLDLISVNNDLPTVFADYCWPYGLLIRAH